MNNEEYSILISEDAIQQKVAEIAEKINNDYKDKEVILVAIANGSIVFAADLLRKLKLKIWFDTIKASSYRGTVSDSVKIKSSFNLDFSGKHVILLDDILDSAKTMLKIREDILAFAPASLRICVLFDKPAGRNNGFSADYCGFLVPDKFIFGYGLDDDKGRYRNLPFIAAKN